jgi:hypothetical protein
MFYNKSVYLLRFVYDTIIKGGCVYRGIINDIIQVPMKLEMYMHVATIPPLF